MAKLFFRFGKFLFFSSKRKNVRRGVVTFFMHMLLLAGVIFTLEIVLIFLGAGDVFLPLTNSARSFLAALMF
jgi:hypothetical protein